MQRFYQPLLACVATIFFISTFAPSTFAATVTKSFTFNIIGSLDNTTNLQTYTFNVTDIGKIIVNVTWTGNATKLTLVLTKTVLTTPANQTDSNSTSFDVTYNVSSENITSTSSVTWTAAVIDYFGNTTANGTVTLSWNALPPSVTTIDATSITSRSATLRGSINPNSLNTTYDFVNESTLGTYLTNDGSSLFTVGPYNGSLNVSANMTKMVAITSLQPSTNYTFRVRAQNDAGTTNGNVLSFMTLAETTTTTTTSSSSTTSSTTSTSSTSTTTHTTSSTSQPPTTSVTSVTTTTTTEQEGGIFSNIGNVIIIAVVGVVLCVAVIFMYLRGWHL